MGRHVAGDAPDMDRLVDEAIVGIGADVAALRVQRLRGVVLGGGYGRGEGGVREMQDGTRHLSNDLDFYVVCEDGCSGAEIAAIGEALAPVSEKWTAKLGVDVDFSPAKTPWRIRHDQERVMIQELLHGYCDVAGEKGDSLFAGIEFRDPEKLPWMESARLLMNRGVGLLLALARMRDGESGDFVVRNIAKCVMGAGDARLIARHAYRWRAEERAEALERPLYTAAIHWKFRPRKDGPCDWETARGEWLDAFGEVRGAGGKDARRRTLRSAARWLVRRKTFGEVATFGLDPVVRVLRNVARNIEGREVMSAALRRDWEVFN